VQAELSDIKEINSGFRGKSTYVYELSATAIPSVSNPMRQDLVKSARRDLQSKLGDSDILENGASVQTNPTTEQHKTTPHQRLQPLTIGSMPAIKS
jgi:hypothetical protein